MMHTAEDLLDLINTLRSWQPIGDVPTLVESSEVLNYAVGKDIVPETALALLHPALPMVAREMLKLYVENDDDDLSISGEYMYDSWCILMNGTIEFKAAGEVTQHLVQIFGIDPSSQNPDMVRVQGIEVTLTHRDYDGVPVPVLTHSFPCDFSVSSKQLDALYAGWSQRLLIGKELGLEQTELARYALLPNVSGGLALPTTIDYTAT